jgi:hypothetical protein
MCRFINGIGWLRGTDDGYGQARMWAMLRINKKFSGRL